MIWTTVSSRPLFIFFFFYWLYKSFSIFGCKEHNISDFSTDYLVSKCRVISGFVGKGCLLWPACSLDKTLVAFASLYFVPQDQSCLLFWVSLDSPLLHSNPLWWRGHLFGVNFRRHCTCSQNQSTSASLASVIGAQTWLTVCWMVYLGKKQIILSFLRLHPSTAFQTLLLTLSFNCCTIDVEVGKNYNSDIVLLLF